MKKRNVNERVAYLLFAPMVLASAVALATGAKETQKQTPKVVETAIATPVAKGIGSSEMPSAKCEVSVEKTATAKREKGSIYVQTQIAVAAAMEIIITDPTGVATVTQNLPVNKAGKYTVSINLGGKLRCSEIIEIKKEDLHFKNTYTFKSP